MKRTQIYLDHEQARELERRAAGRGVTTSKVIREAIDDYLAAPDDDELRLTRFKAAAARAFGSVPRLPDGQTYVEELRKADRLHDDELERHWQR